MAHRRDTPEFGDDGGRHGTQVTLAGVELPERIANMNGVDVGQVDSGVFDRGEHGVLHQAFDPVAGFGHVVGEVGLEAAEDADVGGGHVCSLWIQVLDTGSGERMMSSGRTSASRRAVASVRRTLGLLSPWDTTRNASARTSTLPGRTVLLC